jgi:murein L,D-transpeptidase YafK
MASYGISRLAFVTAVVLGLAARERAHALSIELKDVAADRVERQRAAAAGALPLPGTPNVAVLQERLRDKGVTLASPILIRVFKTESELEIWKQKDDGYILFATYPICHWSGTLGPKLRDGDRQAPEGYYTVTRAQARHVGRWPVSLDIGFPNILDQSQARTGSNILIHGGCSSIGCFAMTNPVSDEIHQLTMAAIDAGEEIVPVEVLPFRMTDTNMAAQDASPWKPFWNNLKEGYDLFERTKRPPQVNVCSGRYIFSETRAGALPGPLEACTPTLMAIREQDQWLSNVPAPTTILPRLTTPATPPPIPQIQTSLETDNKAEPPMFSWPLIR